MFPGTFREARKNGWATADYGHSCPDCERALAELAEAEGGAGLDGLLEVLKGTTNE